MARSVLKQEETVQTAHNILLKDVPVKRERFMQQVQGKITKEKIIQQLLAGMKGIGDPNDEFDKKWIAPELAEKIMALGDDKTINAKMKEVLLAFSQMAKAGERNSWYYLMTIAKDKIAEAFLKQPSKTVETFERMAACGDVNTIFSFFFNDRAAESFVADQSRFAGAMEETAKTTGTKAFNATWDDRTVGYFADWCEGKTGKERFFICLSASDNIAIEAGRPLDDLHGQPGERAAYLKSLSSEAVLALLISNPEYFYTSSNNLLFDRLASDIKNGKFGTQVKTLMDALAKYGLENTELHRNLIFRAINYGRFYGGYSSIFSKDDAQASLDTLLAPLKEKTGFDGVYFYMLANSLENLTPGMRAVAQNELRKCKIGAYSQLDLGFRGAKERFVASSFLLDYLANSAETAVNFDPGKYRGKDGKLVIVQVFDKNDTEDDHWQMSQQWFAKYGAQKKGKDGELIYESKTARIILYMGETDEDNQNFVKKKLSENTDMLLTFRGHSFSFNRNMPPDIFGNCGCKILFIPGSCGSAGSTPAYISANPSTDIDFISNTSTGRGQVTNALLDIFIAEDARIRNGGKLRTYKAILNDKANFEKIKANGGDPATLKASSLGEELLERVYKGK